MSTSTEGKNLSTGQQPDDNKRTLIFAGVAVACLAITGILEWANRPTDIQEFGKVGQEFYPEFTDPTVATSLSVKVINADNLKPLEFSVKQASNGRWVIPSHHNYPADAADQLAQTASSVIGIKRDAMVTRWSSDHPRYGVVDPETDSVTVDEMEGIGRRLTFRGKDDEVLASFIIGKQLEGEENRFYVRHPAEDETYIAELSIDLSTKFGDWVKTDLLDIQGSDILKVDVQDYSFEERGMSLAVTNTIETKLTRETSAEDWKMEGLDEATMQVNAEAMRETVNTLADLAIAGVRPKQPGLTGELELDRSVVANQRDVDRLQNDLMSRGFLLQPTKSNPEELRLIAREGELAVGTADGLSYQLHFGRAFAGSDEELEIGFSSGEAAAETEEETTDEETDESDEDADAEADEADADTGEEESDGSTKPGRYVFVRVKVDPTLLGEKPNPVEPQKSAELIEAEKKAAEAAAKGSEESTEGSEEEPAKASETATEESADTEESSSEEAAAESGDVDTEAEAESAEEEAASESEEAVSEASGSEETEEGASEEEASDEEAGAETEAGESQEEATQEGEPETEANAEAAEADVTEGEGDDSATDESADESAEGEATEAPAESEEPQEDDPAAEAAKLQGMRDAFAAALQQFAADKQALVEYEQKIKAAEEKAVELNRRFAQWYYVIPGEDYDKLSLKQENLIAAKETEEGTPVGEPTPGLQLDLPSLNNPGAPILTPPTGGN